MEKTMDTSIGLGYRVDMDLRDGLQRGFRERGTGSAMLPAFWPYTLNPPQH